MSQRSVQPSSCHFVTGLSDVPAHTYVGERRRLTDAVLPLTLKHIMLWLVMNHMKCAYLSSEDVCNKSNVLNKSLYILLYCSDLMSYVSVVSSARHHASSSGLAPCGVKPSIQMYF